MLKNIFLTKVKYEYGSIYLSEMLDFSEISRSLHLTSLNFPNAGIESFRIYTSLDLYSFGCDV